MSSTVDHDGRPSRPAEQPQGVVQTESRDGRSLSQEGTPTNPLPRNPLRNEREWSAALGEVTGQDVENAFATITSDIRRPDTVPDGAPTSLSIESMGVCREPTTGERTQKVLEADIQEILDIVDAPDLEEPTIADRRESRTAQPPPGRSISLAKHFTIVVIASALSAGLGCILTLLALSSPSARERLLRGGVDHDAQELIAAHLSANAPDARSDAVPADGVASPSDEESPANDGGRDPALSAPDSDGGGRFTGSSDGDLSSDEGSNASPASGSEPDPHHGGAPEQMVLPISFLRGRPTIFQADRTALRRLARSIIAERWRYELIGYATEEEEPDPERLDHLKARRAIKARDLIRSFGPSSARFRARGATSDEPQPAMEARSDEHGVVLLRRIED